MINPQLSFLLLLFKIYMKCGEKIYYPQFKNYRVFRIAHLPLSLANYRYIVGYNFPMHFCTVWPQLHIYCEKLHKWCSVMVTQHTHQSK